MTGGGAGARRDRDPTHMTPHSRHYIRQKGLGVSRREQAAYGGPWPALRLRVLARDGYRCQVRGPRCQGEATMVDHIIPVRLGGAWWDMRKFEGGLPQLHTARVYVGFVSRRRPSREW
jgi:hypothetical protein